MSNALNKYIKFMRGSQAAYDALRKKDDNTLYFITDGNKGYGALYLGNSIISGGDVIINSASLNDLLDVVITKAETNSFLVSDSNGKWINKNLSEVTALIQQELDFGNISSEISGIKTNIITLTNEIGTKADTSYVNQELAKKVNIVDGCRLITAEEAKKLEKLTITDGEITISGSVNAANVNELYDNVIRIVTGSGTAEYDNNQRELMGIAKGAEVNIINAVTNEFSIDENRTLSINVIDASKIQNLSNNKEFAQVINKVDSNTTDLITVKTNISKNTENIITISGKIDTLNKNFEDYVSANNTDIEQLKNILTWKNIIDTI